MGDEPRAGGRRTSPSCGCGRAATSRRHGALAGRWAERLPVRAGVEPGALVTAPAEPEGLAEAFGALGATKELAVGVAALVETVLPWVGGVYGSHLMIATPVSEASVMEVLVEARREGSEEIRGRPVPPGAASGGGETVRSPWGAVQTGVGHKRCFPCCSAGLTAPLH